MHQATLEKVRLSFGSRTPRRVELFDKLVAFVALAKSFNIFHAIHVDGSYSSHRGTLIATGAWIARRDATGGTTRGTCAEGVGLQVIAHRVAGTKPKPAPASNSFVCYHTAYDFLRPTSAFDIFGQKSIAPCACARP